MGASIHHIEVIRNYMNSKNTMLSGTKCLRMYRVHINSTSKNRYKIHHIVEVKKRGLASSRYLRSSPTSKKGPAASAPAWKICRASIEYNHELCNPRTLQLGKKPTTQKKHALMTIVAPDMNLRVDQIFEPLKNEFHHLQAN